MIYKLFKSSVLICIMFFSVLVNCSGKNHNETSEHEDKLKFLSSDHVLFGEDGEIILSVDPESSNIQWTGKKIVGQHSGLIEVLEGKVIIQDDQIAHAQITIDMNSIQNLDIESGKWRHKLESHLKSEDFFKVEEFPISIFKMKSIVSIDVPDSTGHNYRLSGMLTIKDQTHDIEFPVIIEQLKEGYIASGRINIDRTLWGIHYGSGTFFSDLGDKAIDDNFTIDFKVIATMTISEEEGE